MEEKQKTNRFIKIDNSVYNKKFCCITGSGTLKQHQAIAVAGSISQALNNAIENGYSIFVCSAEVGFEMICATTILGLREKNKDVKLILAVPFSDKTRYMTSQEKGVYNYLLKEADKIFWLEDEEKNKMIIDISDMCISFGNETDILTLAKEKGIPTVSI